MTKSIASYLVYALMALAMFAVSRLFESGGEYIASYWSAAFIAVVALDFYKSQVLEDGASEVPAYVCSSRAPAGVYLDPWGYVRVDYFGSSRQIPERLNDPMCSQPRSLGDNFVDRFLGNIFVAPFTLPVKLYEAYTR